MFQLFLKPSDSLSISRAAEMKIQSHPYWTGNWKTGKKQDTLHIGELKKKIASVSAQCDCMYLFQSGNHKTINETQWHIVLSDRVLFVHKVMQSQ